MPGLEHSPHPPGAREAQHFVALADSPLNVLERWREHGLTKSRGARGRPHVRRPLWPIASPRLVLSGRA